MNGARARVTKYTECPSSLISEKLRKLFADRWVNKASLMRRENATKKKYGVGRSASLVVRRNFGRFEWKSE